VLSSCPICHRPLKPAFTDRTLYGLLGEANGLVGNLRAYSCGLKGHVIVVAEGGNGLSRQAESQHHTNGGAHQSILNSWKEIAAYLGRGVRTVQRWEADLGLPVHRPKGKDRSAVLGFTEELDAWLRHTPVRFPARNLPTPVLPDGSQSGVA